MVSKSNVTRWGKRLLSALLCLAIMSSLVDPTGIFSLVEQAQAAGNQDLSLGLGHGGDSSQTYDGNVKYVATGSTSGIFSKTFHMPILEVTLTTAGQTKITAQGGIDQVISNLEKTTPIAGTGSDSMGTSFIAMSPHLYQRMTQEDNKPVGWTWYDPSAQNWQIKSTDDMGGRLVIKTEGQAPEQMIGYRFLEDDNGNGPKGLYYGAIKTALLNNAGVTDITELTNEDFKAVLGNGKWKSLLNNLGTYGLYNTNDAAELWSYFLQNVGTKDYGWAETADYGQLNGNTANSLTDYSNIMTRINNFLNVKGEPGSITPSTGKMEIDLSKVNDWYYDATKDKEHVEYRMRFIDLLLSYYAVIARTPAANDFNNTYAETIQRVINQIDGWISGDADEYPLTFRISPSVGFYVGLVDENGRGFRGAISRVDDWMAFYGGITPNNIWVTDTKYSKALGRVELVGDEITNKVFLMPNTHAKYLWAIWNSMKDKPSGIFGDKNKRPVQFTTGAEKSPMAWSWASTVMTYGHVYDVLGDTPPTGDMSASNRIWYWNQKMNGTDASDWGYSTILVPFPKITDTKEIENKTNRVYGINGIYGSQYVFSLNPPLKPSLGIGATAGWLPTGVDSITVTTEKIGHQSKITVKAAPGIKDSWQTTMDNLGADGQYIVNMKVKRVDPDVPAGQLQVISGPGSNVSKLLTVDGATWNRDELTKFLDGTVSIVMQDTNVEGISIAENEEKSFVYQIDMSIKYGPSTVKDISKLSSASGSTTTGMGAGEGGGNGGGGDGDAGGADENKGGPEIEVTRAYKPDTRMWISSPYTYSEIKEGTIYNEKFEAMAGVPSTETLYFASGGSEFIVDIEAVRIENATAVRKYRSYFDGDECEFKQGDTAPNQQLGEQSANLHGGSVHTKTWTGTCTHTQNSQSCGTCGASGYNACTVDQSNYTNAVAEANAFASTVNGTVLSFTSASDKVNRSHEGWSAGITTSTVDTSSNARPASGGGGCLHGGCSGGGKDHKHSGGNCSSGSACSNSHAYTVIVTWTVPAHIICGPCCQHNLPAVEDTWLQRIRYDYMKITDLHVWKIDQSSVDGMEEIEVDDTDVIQAKIKQGEPNVFYNIAKTETSEAGRLRYNIEAQQHDFVQWHETGIGAGTKRSRTCNGIVSHTDNEEAVTDAGHENSWGHGILYTNPSYGTRADTGLCEGYNEIEPGLLNTTTNRLADNFDWATPEAQRFEQRRTTKVKAAVISDMLILQTSSGDQSVLYFDKESDEKETQQDFVKWDDPESKIKIETKELWDTNTNCAGFGYTDGGVMGRDQVNWINGGSYNGDFTNPSKKYEGTGKKEQVLTKFDSNGSVWDATTSANAQQAAVVVPPKTYRASTIKAVGGNVIASPSLISNQDGVNKAQKRLDRPSNLRLYEDKIEQKVTNPNKSYITGEAEVFWKSILNYHTNDYQVFGTFNNYTDAKYSTTNKTLYKARGYVKGSNYSPDHNKINDIVVHDPVSVSDAIVVGLDPDRDQRATLPKGSAADMINNQNALNVCPLDPGMCEFRTLNCTYFKDTVLASFDFEGGATNTVNGQVYDLPAGFTIESSNRFGTGSSLSAFGTRWSIPFSDIGLTYNPSIRLRVEADYYVPAGTTATMLASFNKYTFYVPSTSEPTWNTGNSTERRANVDVSGKHKLTMIFDFADVDASELYIDGVKVTNYTRVNKSNPLNDDMLGSALNIGSWGFDTNYAAKYYIDNLTITRMAGSSTHTSACYKPVEFHPNGNNTHIHSAACLELPEGAEGGGNTSVDSKPVNFAYTGNIQTFTAPVDGTYKLEVWGAQGTSAGSGKGGLGGYSYGNVDLKKGEKVYVAVGGQQASMGTTTGGYNGGGVSSTSGASGGGATHMAKTSGVLNTLSGNRDSILIVAGGGGGGGSSNSSEGGTGGAGGGTTGGSVNSQAGGTQVDGGTGSYRAGSFGQGGTGTSHGCGGGGGYYGGGGGSSCNQWGGGGSGYIGGVTAGETQSGKQSGNGKASITLISSKSEGILGLDSVIDLMNGKGQSQEIETNKLIGNYTYTGNIQKVTLEPGSYQLEVWGAQGAPGYDQGTPGNGGYSTGVVKLDSTTDVYIAVGGTGKTSSGSITDSIRIVGGYNGGGHGNGNSGAWGGAGGGATHIATRTGELSSLAAYKQDILIVAGGGGGGGHRGQPGSAGGAGGGTSGIAGGSGVAAGTQNTGAAFGQGGSTSGHDMGAGGGGYYGGFGSATNDAGGSGGSGYIGGVISDKGITASTVAGNLSFKAPSGGAETGHTGNGYARITQLTKITGNGGSSNVETPKEPINYAYSGKIEEVTLQPGTYDIEAWGASGANNYTGNTIGGKGAYSKGTFTITSPTKAYILAGRRGNPGNDIGNWEAGGGGGGSFVAFGDTLAASKAQLVAGGGGGAGGESSATDSRCNGRPGGEVLSPDHSASTAGTGSGNGGTGGAGFSADSVGVNVNGAKAFIHGGSGGGQYDSYNGLGGFGGGGTAGGNPGGGGGGYCGGNYGTGLGLGGYDVGGGGGTSFNLGSNEVNYSGAQTFASPTGTNETGHSGNGYVRITPKSVNTDITTGTPLDYGFTGAVETVTLPAGKYQLETWGAEGGGSRLSGNTASGLGGLGGYSNGILTLNSTTTLYIRAGGAGKSADTGNAPGGFNGGGQGYGTGSGEPGNGGGGASDIRINNDSIYARVIVAGGGGGGGEDTSDSYGHGGGTSGVGYNGYDASQTAAGVGGSFGIGRGTNLGDGGGGGGGWYGGGTDIATSTGTDTQGGGGGSGYVYTSATASSYPAGCLLNSQYYLDSASTVAGNTSFKDPNDSTVTGHRGNGYVRITPLSVKNQGNGFGTVTVNNIIKNGSFETTSNWSLSGGAVRDTTQHKFGTTSLKFPAGSGTKIVTQTGITQPIAGHTYYGRQYIHTAGTSNTSDARSEVFNGDGPGKNWTYHNNNGNHAGWDMQSNRITVDSLATTNYYYRTFAVNPTADTWTDGYLLIDLTAAFGKGREPTKEWCDTNLPWFETSYEVNLGEEYFKEIFGEFVWDKIQTEAKGEGTTGTGKFEGQDFTFKASEQVFIAPHDGTYTLEAWGGQGGKVNEGYAVSGGNGGYTKGTVELKAGDKLYIHTGGQGGVGNGGYNGGGFGISPSRASGGGMTTIAKKSHSMATASYVWLHDSSGCTYSGQYHISYSSTICTACNHACGRLYTTPGTSTQVMTGMHTNQFNSNDIVMAAAGGGGSGHTSGNGGSGGGTTGANGSVADNTWGGFGGTQSYRSGSTFKGSSGFRGVGGPGNGCAAAGGAGYYGGAGYFSGSCTASGAGGSSYIGGVTNGTTTAGLNTGNGKAKISWEIQQEVSYDRDKIWEIVEKYIDKIPEKLADGTRNPILICGDILRKNSTAIGDFTNATLSGGAQIVELDGGITAIKIPKGTSAYAQLDLAPAVKGTPYLLEFEYWSTASNSAFSFTNYDVQNTSYNYIGYTAPNVQHLTISTSDDSNMRLRFQGLGGRTTGDIYITNIHVFNKETYYNTHVCDDSCYVADVLSCGEPHHSNLHYDGSNKVCWEACGNDENHKNNKKEIPLADGSVLQRGDFINLDYGFDVYYPNIGDFAQSPNMLGISNLTSTRGHGYVNRMDTSKWTREKKITFDFNVLYERFEGVWEQYNAGETIELPVKGWSYPYYHFYCELANEEAISAGITYEAEAINCSPVNTKNQAGKIDASGVWQEYPYISDGVNNRDNDENTNRMRERTYKAKHSAYKRSYIDVVGRIGNLVASDTDDYRFSNFFKVPVVSDDWIVQGIVKEVYPDMQNNYFGDQVDIRKQAIGTKTNWLDTYGTQTWKNESPVAFPIQGSKNNIQVLQNEQLHAGYNTFLDISTIGSYMYGKLQIYPYFYVLDTQTSEVIPVDVYLKSNGQYKPINMHGLLEDANADTSGIYNYTLNMSWVNESARRNYDILEKKITDRLSEVYQEYLSTTGAYKNMTIPAGTNYTLGNTQYLEIALKGRTFIGTSQTYATEINIENKIGSNTWNKQAQRWHFKLGLPSSSVFVRYDGQTHQVPDVVNTEEFVNKPGEGRYAFLMCADIYAVGNTYILKADLADGNNGYASIGGKKFWLPTNIPRCIAVFEGTSVSDVDTVGTH